MPVGGVCECALKLPRVWEGCVAIILHITGCQPDSGKPTVRDERGAYGNVGYGGIRHPLAIERARAGHSPPKAVRAVFLPDDDGCQRPLRSRFQPRLTPSVRRQPRQEPTHTRRKEGMTDFATFKERQQQGWLTGDFGIIVRTIVLVGELLCEAVDLRPGQQVLDVATGTGNTALAAARRGCDVIGLDWAAPLLARGRERAAAERLPVTFREGEAEQLPFPDASFDAVLSTFGAMYAPDQAQTACELLRVCRSGGKIGLTNFTPESFNAAFASVSRRSLPPPPPVLPSPFLWGAEAHCRV